MKGERCSHHSLLPHTLTDSIMWPLCWNAPVAFSPSYFLTVINLFFSCLLKLVKRKHLRRSAGNSAEGCFVAKKHMGPHIKKKKKRGARDASMPLSSWSHIKGLPRRPAIGSCMMERRRPWGTFNRHTNAGTFLLFYLNGVKHLRKWEAPQYIDPTKKKKKIPP